MINLRAEFLKLLFSKTKDVFSHSKVGFQRSDVLICGPNLQRCIYRKTSGNERGIYRKLVVSLGLRHLQNCADSEKILQTSLKAQ